jgi:hypothetical protein
MFTMQQQLEVAERGRAQILLALPDVFQRGPDDTYLLYTPPETKNALTVELKVESRRLNETPNFFMETWSNAAIQTSFADTGGPYHALHVGRHGYIIYFIQDRTMFIFRDIARLVNRCNTLIQELRLDEKHVPNQADDGAMYYTLGYATPRIRFSDIFTEIPI